MTARAYATLPDLLKLRFQAQGFSYLPRQPVHSLLSGSRASRLRGRGLNFEEIRGYLPGDDIRNIDWKVTARTGKPHTRVYTEERDRPVLLLVDQRINMFFGSQVSTKSTTAVEAAAVSAWRVLGVGDRPGAIVFGDSEWKEVTPHRSETRVIELLNVLMRFNKALHADAEDPPAADMLNKVLHAAVQRAAHDCLVVLISDLYGADDESVQLVSRLAEHNDVMVAFVYDPLESELPQSGRLVVSDGNRQLEFDTANTSLRDNFRQQFDERLSSARSLMLRRSVPVLPIETTRPVVEQIRELIGRAPAGGMR